MVSHSPQLWDTPVLSQSGARSGTEGAEAPSCLGDLGVFRGPLCPKAILSHWVCFAWVCFAWAIPRQTPLDRWWGDRWHWHGWHCQERH